ncbi:MAG: sporulation protein YqfD [Oscillospiraceae bacterium]|jgi:similar to stage IV sporulation protein|nr:sporulation protein YqfD [Oscillospiraceae bacterium]
MLLNFLKWFKGYVEFEATGKFPERFINLTVNRGVAVWELKSQQKCLSGKMRIADYKSIRPLAKKSGVRPHITQKVGLPFFLRSHRHRLGVPIGAALFFVIIAVLGSHIWAVNINGLNELSYTTVTQLLNANGVYAGVKSGDLNISEIERTIMLKEPQIGWISINLEGSVANVEIKEKAQIPKSKTESTPANIVAKKDGVIEHMTITSGRVVVMPGYAVTKGQLLVNCEVPTAEGTVQYVSSEGTVIAKTYLTQEFVQPYSMTLKTPTGEEIERSNVQILSFSFPLSPAFLPTGDYYKQYSKEMLKTDSAILPVGLIKENNIQYKNSVLKFSKKQAERAIIKKMAVYEAMALPKATVAMREINYTDDGQKLICKVKYTLEEDIAVKKYMS